jgi:Polyketide cyclase / dehydrase and lipid transport
MLRDAVEVDVPADALWRAVTDWPLQGAWIPLTRVRVVTGDGRRVGDGIEVWTGIGRVGFLDTMVITRWEPPRVCEVLHTGRVVRGEGGFEVEPVDGTRSRFIWWETFELPLGPVGSMGWPIVQPLWQRGIGRALHELRAIAES